MADLSLPKPSLPCTQLPEQASSVLQDETLAASVAQFKALGHPVRLQMIDLIHRHGGKLCVCAFEQHFDLRQPTISHHLKILRDADLIRSRQEASSVYHFIKPAAFEHLRQLSALFAAEAVPA